MTIKDGGTAFPMTGAGFFAVSQHGMSLRDWLAGQCVAGVVSHEYSGDFTLSASMVADRAYQLADAMIATRAKGDV